MAHVFTYLYKHSGKFVYKDSRIFNPFITFCKFRIKSLPVTVFFFELRLTIEIYFVFQGMHDVKLSCNRMLTPLTISVSIEQNTLGGTLLMRWSTDHNAQDVLKRFLKWENDWLSEKMIRVRI